MKPRPNYGIDSPYIIAGELGAGAGIIALAIAFPHLLGLPSFWVGLAVGLLLLNSAIGMIYYSKVGKLRIRDELLGSIPWRGDETVVDVGCGRGLLLVGAARRLTAGRAIGVDLWLPNALTGNEPNSALHNAALEGLASRTEVRNGDARDLPLPDESVDIVVSNFVLHEMQTRGERQKMVREIARVLKPGGRVALTDFIFTAQCVSDLIELGLAGVERSRMTGFWTTAVTSFGTVRLYKVIGTKDSVSAGPGP